MEKVEVCIRGIIKKRKKCKTGEKKPVKVGKIICAISTGLLKEYGKVED